MNETDFVAQLETLRKRSRPVLFPGTFILASLGVLSVFYSLRISHEHAPRNHTLIALFLGFAIYAIVTGSLFLSMLFIIRRYAPICPSCSEPLTFRQKDDVLSTGLCPRCDYRLFSPAGAANNLGAGQTTPIRELQKRTKLFVRIGALTFFMTYFPFFFFFCSLVSVSGLRGNISEVPDDLYSRPFSRDFSYL